MSRLLGFIFRFFDFLTPKDINIDYLASNLMTMCTRGEGFSRNRSCALNNIPTFVLHTITHADKELALRCMWL
jgi:hypothetical protein